jgi:hypothetical protein
MGSTLRRFWGVIIANMFPAIPDVVWYVWYTKM